MSEKNYEFIDIKRIEPETKSLNVRKVDFSEIYEQTNIKKVSEQASRCLGCGNPYCEWKCPLHNYIPDWLKLIAVSYTHLTLPRSTLCRSRWSPYH